jgi:hypothetical protein
LAQSGGVLGRCELFFKAVALDKPPSKIE